METPWEEITVCGIPVPCIHTQSLPVFLLCPGTLERNQLYPRDIDRSEIPEIICYPPPPAPRCVRRADVCVRGISPGGGGGVGGGVLNPNMGIN